MKNSRIHLGLVLISSIILIVQTLPLSANPSEVYPISDDMIDTGFEIISDEPDYYALIVGMPLRSIDNML